MLPFPQDFHYSTQSVPQPFYISLFEANMNVQISVEEKGLTNETLAIKPMQKYALLYIGDFRKM
jgi:hypothetical protein